MTIKNLVRVTNFYGIKQSVTWLVQDIYANYIANRDWIDENKKVIEIIL